MREIKFRAWDKKFKDLVKNPYLHEHMKYAHIDEMFTKHTRYIWMQYTGLKDRNDREIFESDILINGDIKIKYVVEWLDCGLGARQILNKSTIGLTFWQNTLEIIGNIYESPELLTEKKD